MLCARSNTKAISEVEFMKKLSNTEAEKKKVLLIKELCNKTTQRKRRKLLPEGFPEENYCSAYLKEKLLV